MAIPGHPLGSLLLSEKQMLQGVAENQVQNPHRGGGGQLHSAILATFTLISRDANVQPRHI
jgi:hypothetical protein